MAKYRFMTPVEMRKAFGEDWTNYHPTLLNHHMIKVLGMDIDEAFKKNHTPSEMEEIHSRIRDGATFLARVNLGGSRWRFNTKWIVKVIDGVSIKLANIEGKFISVGDVYLIKNDFHVIESMSICNGVITLNNKHIPEYIDMFIANPKNYL